MTRNLTLLAEYRAAQANHERTLNLDFDAADRPGVQEIPYIATTLVERQAFIARMRLKYPDAFAPPCCDNDERPAPPLNPVAALARAVERNREPLALSVELASRWAAKPQPHDPTEESIRG